jgi:hypothetical protein
MHFVEAIACRKKSRKIYWQNPHPTLDYFWVDFIPSNDELFDPTTFVLDAELD